VANARSSLLAAARCGSLGRVHSESVSLPLALQDGGLTLPSRGQLPAYGLQLPLMSNVRRRKEPLQRSSSMTAVATNMPHRGRQPRATWRASNQRQQGWLGSRTAARLRRPESGSHMWHALVTGRQQERRMRNRSITGALILIVLGVLFLLSNFGWLPRLGPLFAQWWPLILVIVGISLLIRRR
jgi:Domain of unknown function (DUF5668)